MKPYRRRKARSMIAAGRMGRYEIVVGRRIRKRPQRWRGAKNASQQGTTLSSETGR
jgi:predicted dehydrogenase